MTLRTKLKRRLLRNRELKRRESLPRRRRKTRRGVKEKPLQPRTGSARSRSRLPTSRSSLRTWKLKKQDTLKK